MLALPRIAPVLALSALVAEMAVVLADPLRGGTGLGAAGGRREEEDGGCCGGSDESVVLHGVGSLPCEGWMAGVGGAGGAGGAGEGVGVVPGRRLTSEASPPGRSVRISTIAAP